LRARVGAGASFDEALADALQRASQERAALTKRIAAEAEAEARRLSHARAAG